MSRRDFLQPSRAIETVGDVRRRTPRRGAAYAAKLPLKDLQPRFASNGRLQGLKFKRRLRTELKFKHPETLSNG